MAYDSKFLSEEQNLDLEILKSTTTGQIISIIETTDPETIEQRQLNIILSYLSMNEGSIPDSKSIQKLISRAIDVVV